jgi:uncharacterized membrane protein YkoI
MRLLSTLEERMLARNALALVVATALTAAVAGAQQPKSTTPTKSSATQQAPAAKSSSKTSTAQAVPVSADSAKKIVAANEAGATVTSAKLHHASGKAYYEVGYKMKGQSHTMHATVDANTGEFAQKPASTKSSAKKSS